MNVIKTNLNNFLVAENIVNSLKNYDDEYIFLTIMSFNMQIMFSALNVARKWS